jgi:Spy/CpxP family protein refolding chaperone
MKTKIIILSTIIAAFLITGNIFAQNCSGKDGQGNRMQFKEQMKERLNLTDDQLAKIEALRLSHKKQMIDLRADLEKKEVELEELQNTVNFSREAYLNKINEINAAKNKIALARANHRMDVYQLLDENQKKQWNNMSEMMHMRDHKMGMQMRMMN